MDQLWVRFTAATLLWLTPACSGSEPGGVSTPVPQGGALGIGGAPNAGAMSAGAAPGGTSSGGDSPSLGGATAGAAGAFGGSPNGGLGAVTAGGSGGSGAGGMGGVAGAGGAAPGKLEHRFVSGISDGGPVALVAADGHIEWQYDVSGEANDAWRLANGDIVLAYKTGARELTPDKQVVWNYDAPAGSEIHSCQPLPNGFLLGEAHDGGVGYLRELDSSGKLQKTVTIQVPGGLGAHGQFREVRKTLQGTYLVTYLDLGKAREVDAGGNVLREFPCGSFVAIRLKDGNTLVSCGDDHRVIEVDAQGSVVWEVTQKEIPDNQLGFAAGLQRLANGNTIICNWPGHGGVPANQPQAFELTRDKQVVWQLRNPALKLVSNLEVLDADAAIDGVVYR